MISNSRTREVQVPGQQCLKPDEKEVTAYSKRIKDGVNEFYQTVEDGTPLCVNEEDILDCDPREEDLTRRLEPILKSALYNIYMREREDSYLAVVVNDISKQCEEACERFFHHLEENGMVLLFDFCRWVKGDFSLNLGMAIDRPMQESISKVMTCLYNKDVAALLEFCFAPKEKMQVEGKTCVLHDLQEAKGQR